MSERVEKLSEYLTRCYNDGKAQGATVFTVPEGSMRAIIASIRELEGRVDSLEKLVKVHSN